MENGWKGRCKRCDEAISDKLGVFGDNTKKALLSRKPKNRINLWMNVNLGS